MDTGIPQYVSSCANGVERCRHPQEEATAALPPVTLTVGMLATSLLIVVVPPLRTACHHATRTRGYYAMHMIVVVIVVVPPLRTACHHATRTRAYYAMHMIVVVLLVVPPLRTACHHANGAEDTTPSASSCSW